MSSLKGTVTPAGIDMAVTMEGKANGLVEVDTVCIWDRITFLMLMLWPITKQWSKTQHSGVTV